MAAYSFHCSWCWLTNVTVHAENKFNNNPHMLEDDKKYLILCFFAPFFRFQNKQHTSDASKFSNWKIYIVFSFSPPDQPVSLFSYHKMLLVRTAHMKMMSKAGNITERKKNKTDLRK